MAFVARLLPGFYAFRRPFGILILVLVDAVAFSAALGLVSVLNGLRVQEAIYYAPPLYAGWLAIFAAYRLYDRALTRRRPVALLMAILTYSSVLAIGGMLYPELGIAPGAVVLGTVLVVPLASGGRLIFEQAAKFVYRHRLGVTPTLFIGDDETRQWARRAAQQVSSAYACVGELPSSGDGIDLNAFRRELDRTGARRVIVSGAERFSQSRLMSLVQSCRLRKVELGVVPSAATLMGNGISISHEVGLPLLEVEYPTLDRLQRVLKRALDMFGSFFGLLLIAPLLLAVAVAIRLDSPGPVLFRQKRVGTDEKVFSCFKFRSMYEDAEQRQKDLEHLNEANGAVFKIKEDPRITRVGRFLRRWSIDELPQLINVLKGEMSLVGPRPLPVRDFLLMEEAHKRRLGAIPGMTGYWQISGRSDASFEEMVRLDLYYIENWSLSLDAKIIFGTLGAVLRHDGAY